MTILANHLIVLQEMSKEILMKIRPNHALGTIVGLMFAGMTYVVILMGIAITASFVTFEETTQVSCRVLQLTIEEHYEPRYGQHRQVRGAGIRCPKGTLYPKFREGFPPVGLRFLKLNEELGCTSRKSTVPQWMYDLPSFLLYLMPPATLYRYSDCTRLS